jgi:[protein-PII] uridylyltransferase
MQGMSLVATAQVAPRAWRGNANADGDGAMTKAALPLSLLDGRSRARTVVDRAAPPRIGLDRWRLVVAEYRSQIAAALDPAEADGGPAAAVRDRMRRALDEGRATLQQQFEADSNGVADAAAHAGLLDGILRGAMEFACGQLYPIGNPTSGEELALIAVGGYGRRELAPHSDIDILFLYPYKPTPHLEQMAEFLLYRLWDLGLKVGQATRSINECIKLAKQDLTIQTTLLETRLLWGSERLASELERRVKDEICRHNESAFIEAKLAERDARHQRMGDSRYLLEPNVKEGKGGLRDLQTLVWLTRHIYDTRDWEDLVEHDVLTRPGLNSFLRARRFLWAVRCHLHYMTGRAEERLTFDLQEPVAHAMGYRDRPRSRGVERFMKRYYLMAKEVGALTRVVCAALEEQFKRKPRFALPRFGPTRRRIDGFVVQGNRLALDDPDLFAKRPRAMIELFRITQARELDCHPMALTALDRNLRLVVQELRHDPEANRIFLEILTSPKDPAQTLTRMNDAGLLGRFIPEFGRIVALMQHNLYHVYTVDEHTIRVVDNLHRVETGALADELPLSTKVMPQVTSRTELFVAAFLHDIGKGRGGDHSVIGAEIALSVCPRLGLGQAATETVAWLIRHHLVMSHFAFRRDTEDPQTLSDFVGIVQSPERLRLLLVLTVSDIRAVGPTVWNGWKGQLLRELYHEAEAAMASGDLRGRRQQRIKRSKEALAEALEASDVGWTQSEIEEWLELHDPRYWLGIPLAAHIRHANLMRRAKAEGAPVAVDYHVDQFRARTEVTVYATDHPGLFMKVAGALALAGVSIVDAHIFTTADGMALDTFGVQDAERLAAVDDPRRFTRIEQHLRKVLAGEVRLETALKGRHPTLPARTEVFTVEPRVLVNNQASRTHSVIEVNGRDRPGLLFAVAKALKERGLVIHSAHISTYGERVVDVFYVKDVFGMKLTNRVKIERLERELKAALADQSPPPTNAGAG